MLGLSGPLVEDNGTVCHWFFSKIKSLQGFGLSLHQFCLQRQQEVAHLQQCVFGHMMLIAALNREGS